MLSPRGMLPRAREGSSGRGWASALAAAAMVSAATLGAACGGAPPASAPVAQKPEVAKSTFDPCASSDPVWRVYKGPLKRATCEQDMFLTMAAISDQMGASCELCHAEKGNDFDYPKITDNKKIGLWMDHYFMEGLKEKDGSKVKCSSCHVDKKGKSAAKFLGQPRDIPWTVEWMTTVMTNRFVLPDGSKLKCKHCHSGTWGTPEFKAKILMTELPFMAAPAPDFYAEGPPPPTPKAKEPPPPPAATVAPSASAPPEKPAEKSPKWPPSKPSATPAPAKAPPTPAKP